MTVVSKFSELCNPTRPVFDRCSGGGQHHQWTLGGSRSTVRMYCLLWSVYLGDAEPFYVSLWCVIIIIQKKTATTLIWLQRIESEPIVSLCIKATGDHRSASSFSSGLIQSTPHPKEIFIRKHESFSEYPSLLQHHRHRHQWKGLLLYWR